VARVALAGSYWGRSGAGGALREGSRLYTSLPFYGWQVRLRGLEWGHIREVRTKMASAVEPARIDSWHFILWAVGSVVLGAFLFIQPVASAIVLVSIVAVFWLLGGVLDIVHAIFGRPSGWVWHIVGGALAVLAGILVLAHPVVGALLTVSMLYLVVAVSAIASGLIGLFTVKEHVLGSIVLSGLQIVLGVVLVAGYFDLLNLRALVQAIGLVAILGGIAAGVSAFRFTRPGHAPAPR
jgi:Short repeat of unknown function (DUF308)